MLARCSASLSGWPKHRLVVVSRQPQQRARILPAPKPSLIPRCQVFSVWRGNV